MAGGKKRSLSSFLCQELFYDYLVGQLDDLRKTAVEEYLKSNDQAHKELHNLRKAISYCDQLSGVRVTQPFIEEIKEFEFWYQRLPKVLHWSQWPPAVRWSSEAIFISTLAGLFAVYFPWAWFKPIWPTFSEKPKAVLLAQIDKEPSAPVADSGGLKPSAASVEDPKASRDQKGQQASAEKPKETVNSMPTIVVRPSPAKGPVAAAAPAKEDGPEETAVNLSRKKVKPQGFVYRTVLEVEDLDTLGDQLTEQIKKLGGEKSGQVDLGWRKDSKTRYFHFSISEDKKAQLEVLMKSAGKLRISKDPHWRLMPQGISRYIIDMIQTGKGKESKASPVTSGATAEPSGAQEVAPAPSKTESEGGGNEQ